MSNKRALVVDDSKVGRLTMKKKLEAIGVVVDMMESAPEALDYLTQHRPDIIFMDHMMPEMDGFEATRRIKSAPDTREIPVFIISGSDDEDFVREARSHGAVNAITKPPAAGILETIMGSLAEMASAPVHTEAMEPAPQPVAVERRKAPFMDQAAVHALVERVVGEVVDHLHSDLLEELGKQLQEEFESERQAQQALSRRLEEGLEQSATEMAALRKGMADPETLLQQMNAMEQRFLALESEAGKAPPDFADLLEKVQQHVTPRLAELQEKAERQEPILDSLRRELLARVDEQHGQVEQSVRAMAGRLDSLFEDMERLAEAAQPAEAGHDEQRFESIEQRLAAIDSAEPASGLDEASMLAAMEARIAPQLTELRSEFNTQLEELASIPVETAPGVDEASMQAAMEARIAPQLAELRNELQAQFEERSSTQLEKLSEDVKRLADGVLSSEAAQAQRFESMEQRLAAMERVEPASGLDEASMLAAMEARIAPQLAELRSEFQPQLEERSAMSLEESLRESLSAMVREQHEALRAELDGQQGQVQAVEQLQDELKTQLLAQGEDLRSMMDEERERLLTQYEQERAQLAASLEEQQSRLEHSGDDWVHRFASLEEKIDEMAKAGIDDGVQRVLEQRIAHMREVIGAALQPAYPGRETLADVGNDQPSTGVRQDIGEGGAQRPADTWNERLQAEVAQLKGHVKTLSTMLAVGGVALVAAIAALVLLR